MTVLMSRNEKQIDSFWPVFPPVGGQHWESTREMQISLRWWQENTSDIHKHVNTHSHAPPHCFLRLQAEKQSLTLVDFFLTKHVNRAAAYNGVKCPIRSGKLHSQSSSQVSKWGMCHQVHWLILLNLTKLTSAVLQRARAKTEGHFWHTIFSNIPLSTHWMYWNHVTEPVTHFSLSLEGDLHIYWQ